MRVQKTWMNCKACKTEFKGESVVDAPFEVYIASLQAIRCPNCGTGSEGVAFGLRARSRRDDRKARQAHPDASIDERITDWVENGDVGASSTAMHRHLRGLPVFDPSAPRDMVDMRRCLLLLDRIPEFADKLHAMETLTPEWRVLIRHWEELVSLWEGESGPDLDPLWLPRQTRIRFDEVLSQAYAPADSGGQDA